MYQGWETGVWKSYVSPVGVPWRCTRRIRLFHGWFFPRFILVEFFWRVNTRVCCFNERCTVDELSLSTDMTAAFVLTSARSKNPPFRPRTHNSDDTGLNKPDVQRSTFEPRLPRITDQLFSHLTHPLTKPFYISSRNLLVLNFPLLNSS